MKKSELFSLFKEFFNAEVKNMVKQVITEEIRKSNIINNSGRNNSNSSLSDLLEEIEMEEMPIKKAPKKIQKPQQLFKTDNLLGQMLNDTLNERARANEVEDDDDDDMPTFDRRLFVSKEKLAKEQRITNAPDSTLSAEDIRKKNELRERYLQTISETDKFEMAATNSENYMEDRPRNIKVPGGGGASSVQEMLPDDRKGARVPEELADALTKDYTALVKRFKKK